MEVSRSGRFMTGEKVPGIRWIDPIIYCAKKHRCTIIYLLLITCT